MDYENQYNEPEQQSNNSEYGAYNHNNYGVGYGTGGGGYNPYDGTPKPRKKSNIATYVAVAVVCFILGVLVTGFLSSANRSWVNPIRTPQFYWPEATPEVIENEITAPTPFPTERSMVMLDGVAPELSISANPIPDIVDIIAPSVVGVVSYELDEEGTPYIIGAGSGFVISSEGYILTNAHVVEGAASLEITLSTGGVMDAELIAKDAIGDIAVLYVKGLNLKPLKLGDSEDIRVGEYVIAIGNPLSYEGTVTMGIISAQSRVVPIDDQFNTYIQMDVAINAGSSGGPLLNLKGEVIGVNTAKAYNGGFDEYGMPISAEGMSFALPINKVVNIVTQLITKGYVEHAGMGVNIIALTKKELIANDLSFGIRVVGVIAGGPAEQAGVLVDDIILYYDGKRADKQDIIVGYIGNQPVGTIIELTILRGTQTIKIKVNLGDKGKINYDDY